ncbi:MAG: restriction endonuclease subunit S [Terrimicrobiaceae bacterium]
MAGLRTVRISDLGRVVTGKTPPSAQPELFGELHPFLTPTDIDGFARYIEPGRFLSPEGRDYQHRLMLPERAICVVCIGATIGKVCMTGRPSFTNQQINSVIVNENDHDPFFVYHLLTTLRDELKSNAGGAATPIINKTAFSEIEVSVPPLPVQRRIGAILSAYDELMENSQRRIRLLEAMARALYREWFVQFHFPGHEKLLRVASPIGDIPQGWEVKKLGDILELNYGKALRKEDRRDGDFSVFGSSGIVGTHDTSLVKGPGIIVGRKGNVGSVFWCDDDFFVIDTAYFVTSSLPLRFLFYVLPTLNFINGDAAVPGLSRNQAYTLEILVPPAVLLKRFCNLTDTFERQASMLQRQIHNLRRTRDLLLPRLLSEQVNLGEN